MRSRFYCGGYKNGYQDCYKTCSNQWVDGFELFFILPEFGQLFLILAANSDGSAGAVAKFWWNSILI
jgi:hypothetical protein